MVGPNEAPAAVIAGVLSIEFLVHAWDYAMATGRDVDATDSLVEYVLGLAREIITPEEALTKAQDSVVMHEKLAQMGFKLHVA